ncbi:hypothetical protein L596_009121 [Steinernema carpocapsae]|uniref:ABC-2 type transporter domain-containing protein n=1 Tax=Steinernema carpocapsae TaxID=34508 RepID=A0A4U5PEG0_STECR|nr:hypothetical protein L596_009121 [Steinernema carpocapsae]
MISTWKQFRLLLWKGLLIRRHSIAWSILELAIPVILFVFLASIRTRDFTEKKSNCHYDAKAFPSAGVLPFLNSYMCSFTNTCHKSPTTGDDRETINGPGSKESISSILLSEFDLEAKSRCEFWGTYMVKI